MSYVSYMSCLCRLSELCKLYGFFMKRLKVLEIIEFDLNAILFVFQFFSKNLSLIYNDGKPKL